MACARPCCWPGRRETPGPRSASCWAQPGRRRSSGSAARSTRRAVRSVAAEPRPWYALRGVRLVGTGIPGVIALGTRLRKDGRDFAAIEPGRPAIRVELSEESPFGQLIVSVRDADATLAAIRGATGV
jgi:hypothetical protein